MKMMNCSYSRRRFLLTSGAATVTSPVWGDKQAPGSRVAEQLEVATPLFERGVMFDFFHYMSPLRGEAQAALQRWFAAQPSVK